MLVEQVGERLARRQLARLAVGAEHVAPAPPCGPTSVPLAPAVAHGDAHEHVAAAQERARARPGLDRLVGAGERVRPARAQRQQRARSATSLSVSRPAPAPPARSSSSSARRRSQSTGRRLSGSTSESAEQLVALVDVGHARHGQLEQRAGRARRRSPASATSAANGSKSPRNGSVVVERAAERLDAPLPVRVRLDPVRRALGLAQRLLHVGLEALGLDRPGADERLEDEVLLGAVRRAVAAQRRARLEPARARAPPTRSAIAGQRADPRAHVARALGVVRLRHQQVAREARGALGVRGVERPRPRSRSGSGRRRRR